MSQPKTHRILSDTALAAHLARLKTAVYADAPARHASSTSATSSSATFGSQGGIKTIGWAPLGNLVATGSTNRTVRVWNPEKNQVRNSTELKGHVSGVEAVAWNPLREAELASLGNDGTVKVWDVRARNAVGEYKVENAEGGYNLCWRPDGEEIVVGTKTDALVAISRSTMTKRASHKPGVQINQFLFSWSGRELLATTVDGQIRIMDYPSFDLLHSLDGHMASCTTLALAPMGNRLLVGGADALVTLWDMEDLLCLRTFSDLNGPIRSVSFSFDGAYLVAGSERAEGEKAPLPKVASVESGETVYALAAGGTNAGANGCVQVAWAPRSYALAFSGEGPTALRIVGGMS